MAVDGQIVTNIGHRAPEGHTAFTPKKTVVFGDAQSNRLVDGSTLSLVTWGGARVAANFVMSGPGNTHDLHQRERLCDALALS